MPPFPSRRRDAGTALIMVLFSVSALSLTVATALLVCSSEVLATRNYTRAVQAHLVAESAVAEALQLVNEIGVTNVATDVVKGWKKRWGKPRKFSPVSTLSYDVRVSADPADPANVGRLVATATGRDLERNVVVAQLARLTLPARAPGALFLTSLDASLVLKSASLSVEGTDQAMPALSTDGGGEGGGSEKGKKDKGGKKGKKDKAKSSTGSPAGALAGGLALADPKAPGTAPPVLGIATRSDTVAQAVLDALGTQAGLDVRGVGFRGGASPSPSVGSTAAAPSAVHLKSILDLIGTRPNLVTNLASVVAKTAAFGTRGAPAINQLTSAAGVVVEGSARGAGILVVPADLTVRGRLEFDGLLIVGGRTIVESGSLRVHGSLWTSSAEFLGGDVTIAYSSEALALADGTLGQAVLPAPVLVTALVDCSAVRAPAAGCP